MIIVLHGEDTFRSRIKLRELIAAYQEKYKGSVNFSKFDALSAVFADIKLALENRSIFDYTRLIVVEDILGNASLKNDFNSYKNLDWIVGDANIFLIFFEARPVASDDFYKKVLPVAHKVQEFKDLPSASKVNWFCKFFESTGTKLNKIIIKEVVDLCEGDMWRIYNEIQKLLNFKNSSSFTTTDLITLKIGAPTAHIFPTIDYIYSGNADKAMRNIQIHWAHGEVPQVLFNMMQRQLKTIVLVKEQKENGINALEIAQYLALHPYVVKKTLPLVDKFSWGGIKDLYRRIESLDTRSKSGQLDPRLACELLAAAILVP